MAQVYPLRLKDDGSPEISRGYVYLPPPSKPAYLLRIVVEGRSPLCYEGTLWVNMPEEDGESEPTRFRGFASVVSFPDLEQMEQLADGRNIAYGMVSTTYMSISQLLVPGHGRTTSRPQPFRS